MKPIYVDFIGTTKPQKPKLCGFHGHHQTIKNPNDMDFMGTTKPQEKNNINQSVNIYHSK